MLYEYFVMTWMPISGAPWSLLTIMCCWKPQQYLANIPILYHCVRSIMTLSPGDTYMYQWIGSALVQVMAWHLFRCQTITWTNADFLSIGPLEIKLSEIWIKMRNIFLEKMWLKLMSAKYQLSFSSFCVFYVYIYCRIDASIMSTKAKSEDVMINWLQFSQLPVGPWACGKQMKLMACIERWVITHWGWVITHWGWVITHWGLNKMANIL